jgi:hypothetical protein
MESDFTITHGSGALKALTTQLDFTVYAIPNETDWSVARFDYDTVLSASQIVTVQSTQSIFSLGYITGSTTINNSYGYFSAYGAFEFPTITSLSAAPPSPSKAAMPRTQHLTRIIWYRWKIGTELCEDYTDAAPPPKQGLPAM